MVYTGALQRDYERLNMMTLQEFLEKQFDENLMLAVLSGQRSKEKEAPSKVRIRQIELKGSVCYQASSTVGTKVLHSNYSREEVIAYVEQSLQEGGFSQLQVQGRCKDGSVLVSKKGKVTVKVKEHQAKEPVQILAHNRVKQYILKEGTPVPFLVDLGVMNKEGKIHRPAYDKFKQINRFLEFIEDILPALSREREVTILDFGCGKSYLTFAMYYYLKELKKYDVHIIGLDLKEDVSPDGINSSVVVTGSWISDTTFNTMFCGKALICGQSLMFGPNLISTLGSATPLLSNTRFS